MHTINMRMVYVSNHKRLLLDTCNWTPTWWHANHVKKRGVTKYDYSGHHHQIIILFSVRAPVNDNTVKLEC